MVGRKVFVCYRREDTAGHAGRLYDRLNLRFPGRVFMDVAGIGLGTRWAQVIEQTLESCEVVLLLIGRRWLERLSDGPRRIDDPDDPLRAEVTTALRLQRRIVPVLVGGAVMPAAEDLPADVAPVTAWQAVHVGDDDFDHDAQRLIRAIERWLHDEGADPHLDKEAARRAQVDVLLAESATAARAGEWVTAAQTLRSVLSLDPGNAQASRQLRDVEARWAEAYRKGQVHPVVRPGPKSWAVAGVVAVLAAVCAMVVVLVIAAALVLETADADPDAGFEQPIYAEPGVQPGVAPSPSSPIVTSPAPEAVADALPARLVGRYLLAGYSQEGTPLPVVGRLTLAHQGSGQLGLEMQASNQVTGAAFWYRGILQMHAGGGWTMTTTESNDPTALAHPVQTQLTLDGGVLTAITDDGVVSVWQKQ